MVSGYKKESGKRNLLYAVWPKDQRNNLEGTKNSLSIIAARKYKQPKEKDTWLVTKTIKEVKIY